MSKKLVEGTIKIASVGMAAVMATTPMATLAADADVVSSDAQPTVEDMKPANEETAEKKEIQEASQAVADAQTAVEGANDLMDTALESNEAMGEGAITKLPTATIPEGDVDAAEGELSDLAQNISDMKDANTEADAAEAENNGYIADAGEVASDLNADMSTAASDFAARRDAMNNATTTTDTDAAYAQAVAIADAAQAEFNEKSAEYDAILQKISDNNAVIAAAQARYDEAVANASDNLDDAKTELAAAKQLATELEAAAEAKKNELLQSGAAAIIAAQDTDFAKNGTTTEQNKVKWNYKADVLTAILKNFYVPEDATNVKVDPKKPGEKEAGKEASKDGNAHYYILTYTKNGQKTTEYLDYKLDENGDLIIFAKTPIDIDVYRYKIGNNYTEVDKTDVVTIDGKDFVLIDAGTPETIIATGFNDDRTIETRISDTEEKLVLENGQPVKVTKGIVTTITKTTSTLSGGTDEYASETAAKEAAQAKRDALTGDITFDEDVSATKHDAETHQAYVATLQYAPKFTLTIDNLAWEDRFVDDFHLWNYRPAQEAALAATGVVEQIKALGYTIIGSPKYSDENVDTWNDLVGWAAEGTIDVSITFARGYYGRRDFYYYAESISGESTQNKQGALSDARTNAGAKAQEEATALTGTLGLGTVSGAVVEGTSTVTNHKQRIVDKEEYWTIDDANYTLTTTEVGTEKVEVAKVTYNNAKELEHVKKDGVLYGNAGYTKYLETGDDSDIIMFEGSGKKDLGLNAFLQQYRDKKGAYETLASQAQAAKNAYITAEEKVNAIQASIDALKEQAKVAGLDANQIALQAELTVALEQAERDMTEAEETLKGITGQLTALLTERNARILALTPAPAAPAAAVATPAVAAAPVLAAVPGAGVAAAAPALVPGADVATPQANVQLDNNNNVTANDVETSLANMTLDDVTEANTIMGWWWLLIIALLGGTGYTMYRKHQQKKAAQTIDKTK